MLVIVAVQSHSLGRPFDCFSTLAACMAPSDIIKAGPQIGSFQISSSSVPLEVLCLKHTAASATWSCLQLLEGRERQQHLHIWRVSDSSSQQFERRFPMFGTAGSGGCGRVYGSWG